MHGEGGDGCASITTPGDGGTLAKCPSSAATSGTQTAPCSSKPSRQQPDKCRIKRGPSNTFLRAEIQQAHGVKAV